ncbi:hypothetical protein R1flu_002282 [Riccia fluitans]|uniref:Transcription factor CBF/NF-Y/archaeal histone domain-containing protein n=1 Tax=Riccia fluitans TaxID=41844 RepID=A0ABD1Y5N1_9MARC
MEPSTDSTVEGGELNEVGETGSAEEDASNSKADVMNVDRGETGSEGIAVHDRNSNEVEKQVEAEEAGAISSVGAEPAGGGTANTEGPSGESAMQLVREKRRPKSSDDEPPPVLPFTRVKRIIKMDPDIRLVSKEGIFAIIQATQHFLEALAAESISQTWKNKRKGVKSDDIIVAAKNPKFRDCLGSSVSDFVKHLREDSEDEDGDSEGENEGDGVPADSKKGNKNHAKQKCLQPPPGNRSIMDFLKAAS